MSAGSERITNRRTPADIEIGVLLDEVYQLRRALAYEAMVVKAHYEGYKTFPKSRRKIAEEQVERMQAAARGKAEAMYAPTSHLSLRHALLEAGASETLTRWQFIDQHPTLGADLIHAAVQQVEVLGSDDSEGASNG